MDHNLHLNPTPTSILLGSTHLNPTLIQDPMAHLQTQAYYPSFSGKSMSEFPFPEPKSQIFFFQKLFSMHFKLPCSVYSLNIRCISNWPTSHMLDLHTPKSLCPLMLVRFDYSYTNPLFPLPSPHFQTPLTLFQVTFKYLQPSGFSIWGQPTMWPVTATTFSICTLSWR